MSFLSLRKEMLLKRISDRVGIIKISGIMENGATELFLIKDIEELVSMLRVPDSKEQTMRGILEKFELDTTEAVRLATIKHCVGSRRSFIDQAEASLKSLIGREVIGEDEKVVDENSSSIHEDVTEIFKKGINKAKAEARKRLEEL